MILNQVITKLFDFKILTQKIQNTIDERFKNSEKIFNEFSNWKFSLIFKFSTIRKAFTESHPVPEI